MSLTKVSLSMIQGVFTPQSFGAVADGVNDDTAAIQAAINAAATNAGATVYLSEGVYLISDTLTLKSKVRIFGDGYGITTIRQKTGSNKDMIVTEGYGTFANLSAPGVPVDYGVEQLTLDGNYLANAWNNATNTINNSLGYGIKSEGIGYTIDVEMVNIPEVGLRTAGEAPIPTTEDVFANVKLFGRVFGKEGAIITGPNDFLFESCWLGLCGILPRPAAETTFATSTVYSGNPVAGVVLDGVNIEVGDWHIYACWSGPGIKTRNTVRLEGNHIISESNNSQIDMSTGSTFGVVSSISLRNLALYHPNWTAAAPSYTSPDPRWDAFTCASISFQSPGLRIFRSITAPTHIVGTNGLVLTGTGCSFNAVYSNSTAPVGDPEAGSFYSGSIAIISGNNNVLNVAGRRSNGEGIVVSGSQNLVSATLTEPVKYGVQATGNQNNITSVVNSQTQDTGVGSAFYNDGDLNTWNTTSVSNAVPYQSNTGLNRVAGVNLNSTLRTFTIATGAITVTTFDNSIFVDTEGGAGTDDLDSIAGGARFQQLILAAANSGRDVVLKDGTGNLKLNSDFTLSHAEDRVVLQYDGTNWCELSRSDNTA